MCIDLIIDLIYELVMYGSVITWLSEWKSCENYQPQLHLIRFDFYHDAQSFFIYATE